MKKRYRPGEFFNNVPQYENLSPFLSDTILNEPGKELERAESKRATVCKVS